MSKRTRKAGLFVSAAFAVCLMGQVAYAAQNPIAYNYRLESTGTTNTGSIVKTNSDSYADNYVSYFGWAGSGVEWWMTEGGKRISDIGHFAGTGNSRVYYTVSGSSINGKSLYAKIKTDSTTWHECDVAGKIYP